MEKRIEMGFLLDAYGPLLTDHRREILRAWIEEDLSLQEIAETLGITRQGVYDAIGKGERQLEEFEEKLGWVKRSREADRAANRCLTLLEGVQAAPESAAALEEARKLLREILLNER